MRNCFPKIIQLYPKNWISVLTISELWRTVLTEKTILNQGMFSNSHNMITRGPQTPLCVTWNVNVNLPKIQFTYKWVNTKCELISILSAFSYLIHGFLNWTHKKKISSNTCKPLQSQNDFAKNSFSRLYN